MELKNLSQKNAFDWCEKLNPPLYPIKPMSYGVRGNNNLYEVIDLRTKKIVIIQED